MVACSVGDPDKEKNNENYNCCQRKSISGVERLTVFLTFCWSDRRCGYGGRSRNELGRGRYRGRESIPLASDRLYEARLFAAVAEGLADLTNSAVDTVVGVEVDVRSPDSFDDLVARDELPGVFGKKEKQLQRNALQLDWPSRATEFVGSGIKLEVVTKSDGWLAYGLPGHYVHPRREG